jgi:hypothetical protein
MADHVRIAAILRIVYSALGFLVAAVMFLFFGGIGAIASPVISVLAGGMAMMMLICALPSMITAWGMLAFRPWARILGIVFAAIDLFNFPVGTALGAYTLWVLLHPATVDLFEQGGPVRYPYP